MNYYGKNKLLLSYNDYVEIQTDIGIHKGYIRSFCKNGNVHVNCLVGEFWVNPNKITPIIIK